MLSSIGVFLPWHCSPCLPNKPLKKKMYQTYIILISINNHPYSRLQGDIDPCSNSSQCHSMISVIRRTVFTELKMALTLDVPFTELTFLTFFWSSYTWIPILNSCHSMQGEPRNRVDITNFQLHIWLCSENSCNPKYHFYVVKPVGITPIELLLI